LLLAHSLDLPLLIGAMLLAPLAVLVWTCMTLARTNVSISKLFVIVAVWALVFAFLYSQREFIGPF